VVEGGGGWSREVAAAGQGKQWQLVEGGGSMRWCVRGEGEMLISSFRHHYLILSYQI